MNLSLLTWKNRNKQHFGVSQGPIKNREATLYIPIMKGIRGSHSWWKGSVNNSWGSHIEDHSCNPPIAISLDISPWPSQDAGMKHVNFRELRGKMLQISCLSICLQLLHHLLHFPNLPWASGVANSNQKPYGEGLCGNCRSQLPPLQCKRHLMTGGGNARWTTDNPAQSAA